jgi:transposase
MPDVSLTAPARVRTWVAIDQHKLSLVAATLPATGGAPEVVRLENTERAVRRFVEKLGGPEGLAVCYEAGPGGYQLYRLLTKLCVACDVIAPSLIPIRAGDRVRTDRRDAKKLVRLYRAGELVFVAPPSPEQEGLRDLVGCRDDLRRSRTAARHQISKQLLRHGHIYRGGKGWTVRHQAWIASERLADPLAQSALEHMLTHLAMLTTQLAAVDGQLERVASSQPWAQPVAWLVFVSRDRYADRARSAGGDRRFSPVRLSAGADELPRADPDRVLLRRPAAPRAHHQGRQHARPPAADQSSLKLSTPPPPIRPRRAPRRPGTAGYHRARVAGPDPPVSPSPRSASERETLHRRGHRGRPRAPRIPLGSDGPSPTPPTTSQRGRRCLTPDPNTAGVRRPARPS